MWPFVNGDREGAIAIVVNIFRHIRDRRTLEVEYSPSSCVPDMKALVESYGTRSLAARARLERRVVRYGESSVEEFDIFAASASADAQSLKPVVVYIHGGYWQELSKNEHSFPALSLNECGVSYIALNYGLAPDASLDEMVARCRRALVWVANHAESLGVDKTAIHVAGSSAGAHLAAMTALTDWARFGLASSPLRSLCLMSGVFDLRPLPLTYVNDALGMTADDALRNSPMLLVDSFQQQLPRTLVVWGEHETSEFKRQSLEFATVLARKGAAVRVEEIDQRNHFDLVFDLGVPATRFGALTLEHFHSH